MRNFRGALWAAAVFAIVLFAYDLNRLYALRYGADLGTFLQTLVNWRHATTFNYGEWRPHLQVHDSWALIVLVPLIAVVPRAETLLAIQVLAVASAAIPLALLGRELGLSPRAATIVAIGYLLTPSAQGLAYDNFSENVFVPVLAFSGLTPLTSIVWYRSLPFSYIRSSLNESASFS